MNLGIKQAKGKYILLLNPDVAIFEKGIEKMITFLDSNPEVGLIGPRLINPDGSVQLSCRCFPSPKIILYRRSPLGKLPNAKKQLRKFMMSDQNHQRNQEVDWMIGACFMASQKAIKKVGLMDERFFLYFEDVDWCRRFWQNGYKVIYFADSEMVHYHQRLSALNPGLKGVFSYVTRIHIQSGIKYFLKYRGKNNPRKYI